jgi:DNA uptake protein ComE-like DNA-binding protein
MTVPRAEIWTSTQRKTLLGLCFTLLIFLMIESIRNPIQITDPPLTASARSNEIQDRLDPNTADAAALSAIPNLGESRAEQIVDYRENFTRQHPGVAAFKSADDLMRVKGIGPGVSSNMSPYLIFRQKLISH